MPGSAPLRQTPRLVLGPASQTPVQRRAGVLEKPGHVPDSCYFHQSPTEMAAAGITHLWMAIVKKLEYYHKRNSAMAADGSGLARHQMHIVSFVERYDSPVLQTAGVPGTARQVLYT